MTSIPGLNMPTQTAMLAGNPRDSAIASQTNANDKLAALNKAVGGNGASTASGYLYGQEAKDSDIGVWRDLSSPEVAINRPVTLWTGRRYRNQPVHTPRQRRRAPVHTTRRHRRVKHVYTRKQTKKRSGRKRCRCHCPCKVCRTMCMYHSRPCGAKHGGGGATDTVQVPQFTMQYAPTGGPGQTPNDLIKQNSQISTQSTANAAYDKFAAQK